MNRDRGREKPTTMSIYSVYIEIETVYVDDDDHNDGKKNIHREWKTAGAHVQKVLCLGIISIFLPFFINGNTFVSFSLCNFLLRVCDQDMLMSTRSCVFIFSILFWIFFFSFISMCALTLSFFLFSHSHWIHFWCFHSRGNRMTELVYLFSSWILRKIRLDCYFSWIMKKRELNTWSVYLEKVHVVCWGLCCASYMKYMYEKINISSRYVSQTPFFLLTKLPFVIFLSALVS